MAYPFQTILCALDLSEASLEALETAWALAERLEAELYVVHVLDQPCLRPEEDLVGHDPERMAAELREHAESELEMLIEWAGIEKERLAGIEVRRGETIEELLDAAEACNADLIVVRTHGRRGIDRYLQRSVAEALIQEGAPAVLTIGSTLPSSDSADDEVFDDEAEEEDDGFEDD